jgi:hypothetical protein
MIAFVVASSLSVAATETVLVGSKIGTVVDRELRKVTVGIKVDFKMGTVRDSALCTVVLLDIKLGSKLGTILDRGLCTGVVLDIELGSKLGTVDGELPMVVVLDIELGSKFGTGLDRELCTVG